MLDTNTVVVNRSWEPGLLAQTHGGTEMPKNFSTADAKALIAKHEELYQQLIEICDEKEKTLHPKSKELTMKFFLARFSRIRLLMTYAVALREFQEHSALKHWLLPCATMFQQNHLLAKRLKSG